MSRQPSLLTEVRALRSRSARGRRSRHAGSRPQAQSPAAPSGVLACRPATISGPSSTARLTTFATTATTPASAASSRAPASPSSSQRNGAHSAEYRGHRLPEHDLVGTAAGHGRFTEVSDITCLAPYLSSSSSESRQRALLSSTQLGSLASYRSTGGASWVLETRSRRGRTQVRRLATRPARCTFLEKRFLEIGIHY